MKKFNDIPFILAALCFFIYAATKYTFLLFLGGLLLLSGGIMLIINSKKK